MSSVPPLADLLSQLVVDAAARAGHSGILDTVEPATPTNNPKFGDYQSNHAFRLGKALRTSIHRTFRPARIHVVRINRRVIHNDVVQSVMSLLAIGVLAWVGASLYLALRGIDIVTATTAVAATLFNIGPGLAKVGSVEHFGWLPADIKAVLSFCMVLGRLEFYTLLVLFVPSFWRD